MDCPFYIIWDMEYEILTNGKGKITEKKSVFIASVVSVKDEQEALSFIAAKKKEYYDARHNCYAYLIGENNELMRFSDDGEPSGTAGRPMLDVLTGAHVHNVCVVVTRYFGGVLLGTGGLVRAYTKACEEGLKDCVFLERHRGWRITLETDYGLLGKIVYYLNEKQIFINDTKYNEKVTFEIYAEEEVAKAAEADLVEQTGGQIYFHREEECSYGIAGNKLHRFS